MTFEKFVTKVNSMVEKFGWEKSEESLFSIMVFAEGGVTTLTFTAHAKNKNDSFTVESITFQSTLKKALKMLKGMK